MLSTMQLPQGILVGKSRLRSDEHLVACLDESHLNTEITVTKFVMSKKEKGFVA